jgi:GDSL-like Lipase/Acylhydrolase family
MSAPMSRWRRLLPNLALAAAAVVSCFLVIEAGYRLLDPFPFLPPWEVNRERGHLTRYDPELGWSGNPGVRETFVTENSRTFVENNSLGFRDVEHPQASPFRDAIVFLGDSFTWGFEISTDAMFVNRMRPSLRRYEVFNLAHRGYGTDQSLLTLRRWRWGGRLRLVILMFCENDFRDNASELRYNAYKPRAQVQGEALVWTNVPVPVTDKWTDKGTPVSPSLSQRLLATALSSHLLHDVYFRLLQERRLRAQDPERNAELMPLTSRLLEQLRDDVTARGGELLLVTIPSKRQFRNDPTFTPYQPSIEAACGRLGISYLDLAPGFEKAVLRTYFRIGDHWNEGGNQIAAREILEHLRTRKDLVLDP